MNRKPFSIVAIILVGLATLGGIAFAAQDRYTLKLGELAFSDFKGYEDWKVVAASQTETALKVILANDVMMDAYRQGLPADGKLFPEGSKIVKIEWTLQRTLCPRIPCRCPLPSTRSTQLKKIPRDSRTRTDGHTANLTMMPHLTRLRL